MKYKNSRKYVTSMIANEIGGPSQWIEYLLEPAEWPQKGDSYWIIIEDGTLRKAKFFDERIDTDILKFGNCFRTEKEAIKARNNVRSLLKGTIVISENKENTK